jgi:hypothetical protein
MTTSTVADLMALATVRRLLLELGHELQPEAPGTLVGPLERWIREPRPQLDGQSPIEALAQPAGESRVRECLQELIAMAVATNTDVAAQSSRTPEHSASPEVSTSGPQVGQHDKLP